MKQFRGSRSFAAALCALALTAALIPSSSLTAARAKSNRRGGEWTVLAPVSYKNLTIFPVRGADLAGSEAYITLDEGTKAGSVVITEKGTQSAGRGIIHPNAANPSAAVRQQSASYSSSGASVNELALVNRSGKKLLLLAGEVVVGGKQDRIVQEDRVVPPVSVPVALNVFCVEHGRWTPRAASYSGGGGSGRAVAPTEAPDDGPAKFSSLGAVAHPKLRGAAQDKKAQGEVWKEVSENNARLGTANSTDTYQEVYASKKVVTQVDDYVRTLEREVLQPGVVGVVVARNGRAVWADVFASQRLFASYWPKLLKSYVVDAIGDYKDDKRPSVDEADSYLRQREGTVTTTTQEGVYQLVKTEQAAYAVFELRDISLASPLQIHFNKMDR
ncbi:MAG: ARPP-1 family domain-containing protein [Pyrinomonadaceae bacterium]